MTMPDTPQESVKRWDKWGVEMRERADGDYVLYSDLCAERDRVRAETVEACARVAVSKFYEVVQPNEHDPDATESNALAIENAIRKLAGEGTIEP